MSIPRLIRFSAAVFAATLIVEALADEAVPTAPSAKNALPLPKQPLPVSSAARPEPQLNPLFLPAHRALLQKRTQGVIDVYFLGDSITRRWQGTDYPEHKQNWDANFHGWNAANFGWGGDTTQNVLWRLEHGELDGVNPKVVVLMIGTNNVGNVPSHDEAARIDDISGGIRAILNVVRNKAPRAKVILMGITPRNEDGGTAMMPTIRAINDRIATFADAETVIYINLNDKLADSGGHLFDNVSKDGLHLSIQGYQIWADALKPLLTHWLGSPAAVDHAPPATGIPDVDDARPNSD
jgi:lysophospholipase L1-like esterase